MNRYIYIGITIALALLLLFVMFRAWRRRQRRDGGLVATTASPAEGGIRARFEILYVSTTMHEFPLERLAIKHLAYRSRGEAIIAAEGLYLDLDGTPTILIAKDAITAVGRARVTIDRVVEKGGLVKVTWRADADTLADSYLRVATGDPGPLLAALEPFTVADKESAQ